MTEHPITMSAESIRWVLGWEQVEGREAPRSEAQDREAK
jgi:hypothetical protein